MNKGKLEYVAYLVLTIAVSVFILIGISKAANAQQSTVFVECIAGDYPDEITWQILTCNGGILLEGGAPFLGAVVLPQYYQINMQDSYGDGWNNGYLYIDEIEYGFLSDVDWIDSLGTWPQDNLEQLVDVGCLTIGLEELNINTFKPKYYYDILGREVEPTTGFYIVSDGTLTRKIYTRR
tara:strand:- start:38 stop:577 length:540 start_codon:yes stop_codon:yes gene_type:complete